MTSLVQLFVISVTYLMGKPHSPPLRRGGFGINKKARSHRNAADGVVAHKFHFKNAF